LAEPRRPRYTKMADMQMRRGKPNVVVGARDRLTGLGNPRSSRSWAGAPLPPVGSWLLPIGHSSTDAYCNTRRCRDTFRAQEGHEGQHVRSQRRPSECQASGTCLGTGRRPNAIATLTRSSTSPHSRLTWLLKTPLMPSDFTRSSTVPQLLSPACSRLGFGPISSQLSRRHTRPVRCSTALRPRQARRACRLPGTRR
jgi:hypothetical protein